MAAPSVASYNTNGWVNTGRTDKLGEWFKASLKFESVGTPWQAIMNDPVDHTTYVWYNWSSAQAAGYYEATFPHAYEGYILPHDFIVHPTRTWAEYPTGVFEVGTRDGVVVTPQVILDSVADNWKTNASKAMRVADPEADWQSILHGQEYRFACWLGYTSSTSSLYWLSEGGGTMWFDAMPSALDHPHINWGYYGYIPAPTFTLDVTLEVSLIADVAEQVWIKQVPDVATHSDNENWDWDSPDDPHQWMGKLAGEYRMTGAQSESGFIADGIIVNGVPHIRKAMSPYMWSTNRTVKHRAGLAGSVTDWQTGTLQTACRDHVSATELSFCKASIGTTNMDLRLGHDSSTRTVPIEYKGTASYTSPTESCSARGEDNEIEYLSTKGGLGYVQVEWSNSGLSYQWDGDVRHVDGTALEIDPEFTDSAGHSFVGSTAGVKSPIYVYSGVWLLNMFKLDGISRMDTHSPSTDWSTNKWVRSDPAPTEFSLRLTNPGDYSDCEFEEEDPNSYEDPPATITKTDSRILLQYPREKAVISFVTADYHLDDLNTVGDAGVGGWNASGCTLTEVGGKLVATDVTEGAYIYRADFLHDDNEHRPKHWPFYRFCNVVAATVEAGTSTPADYAGSLVVKRTVGQDVFTKTFSHFKQTVASNVTTARYDTCRPVASSGADVTQSGITQMQAEQTAEFTPYMELSSASWSWGILGFDRIEIHLEVGLDYTFESLDCIPVSGAGYTGHGIEIEREYNRQYYPGDIWVSSKPDVFVRQTLYRSGVINSNGRWCADIPAVRMQIDDRDIVRVFKNYSLYDVFIAQKDPSVDSRNSWGMFPPDDFASWEFEGVVQNTTWWDDDAQCYTDEGVLFYAPYCPVGFLQDCHEEDELGGIPEPYGVAAYPRDFTHALYARPVYDVIKGDGLPWFGDGRDRGETTRRTCAVFKFVKRVRARVQGLAWQGSLTPEEIDGSTIFPVRIACTENDETVDTDRIGHFRSTQHKDLATVTMTQPVAAAPLNNRTWYRVCDSLWLGDILAATQSVRSLRLYVLHKHDGNLWLRVYDDVAPEFQDRDTGLTATSCHGITLYEDNADKLTMTYESASSIYRVQSDDDGESWGTPVSIATGTNPCVVYSVEQHVEMCGYINGSGKACVVTKFGDNDYSAEVEIADGAAIAIAYLNGDLAGQWAAIISTSSSVMNRYLSSDQGQTWAVG